MFSSVINYFESLNSAGQALFVVGVLLVFTFIVLLIVVFKPENKPKKIYGENPLTDRENQVLEKLKDINNISDDDINIENDKTKNLKTIVDELKGFEEKEIEGLDTIQRYEDEQEDTAVISVNELLKASKTYNNEIYNTSKKAESIEDEYTKEPIINIDDNIYNINTINPPQKNMPPIEENKYIKGPEIFSSVFSDNTAINKTNEQNIVKDSNDNEMFLNSLKEFRNNL